MKKILCYGDSNTFGFNPVNGSRFDDNTRWTKVLESFLPDEYSIIEEGANNRNGVANNPSGFLYSAQRHFPKIIAKANDLNLIILAIGTNDLQFQYKLGLTALEKGIEVLINCSKNKTPNTIIIPPVILDENVLQGYFRTQFDEISIIKSRKVGKIYKKLAKIYNCQIFDINEFARPSTIDGLHYSAETHKLIAQNLSQLIIQQNI